MTLGNWYCKRAGGRIATPSESPWHHRPLRCFSRERDDENNPMNQPREVMHYDVVIVDGGPADLAASIRLKQLCAEKGVDLIVCVLEKGSEVGSHILSGNVFDPRALEESCSRTATTAGRSGRRPCSSWRARPSERRKLLCGLYRLRLQALRLRSHLRTDASFSTSAPPNCAINH